MNVEAPSIGTSIGTASVGSSIGSSAMEGPSIGGSMTHESFSNIMSMPELRVSATSFSLDTRVPLGENTTITQIKRPEGMATPRTEVPQVFRDAWSEPGIKIPDHTVTPLVKKDEPKKNQGATVETIREPSIPKPEMAPPMTIKPEQDVLADAGETIQMFQNRQEEQTADAKLAQDLKIQIETNPNLSSELKTKLVQKVDATLETKIQTQDVLQPQGVTQTANQDEVEEEIENVRKEIPIDEPWWDINTVQKEITVDEQGTPLEVDTRVKYEGEIPQRKLEKPARELAETGAKTLVYDPRWGWREGIKNSYAVEDIDQLDQKAA